MMRFGNTKVHTNIIECIREKLLEYSIVAMRADDKQYHDDLYYNILTYMYGCDFGISIFERIESDDFNPNVSLEVGYMLGLRKDVCFLKDKSLRKLPSDLVGRLYKEFDTLNVKESVSSELEKWLKDKNIITGRNLTIAST
jgi:nucleoside 2-deoxyribosyltransferase